MNAREEATAELILRQNPLLTRAEAARFARELSDKFNDVENLVSSKDLQDMRRVVSEVDGLIRQLRDIMDDKEVCHFYAAAGGFMGLIGLANPLMFGVGVAISALFGVGAVGFSQRIRRQLRQIEDIIRVDRVNFRLVADKIRDLDELSRRYLRNPLFSEENLQFLRSAAEYIFTKKQSARGNAVDRVVQVLRDLAIAESLAQFYGVIQGCAVVGSASAMVPLLALGLQTLLLIKDVEENNDTMFKLSKGVAAMRKKIEVLGVVCN